MEAIISIPLTTLSGIVCWVLIGYLHNWIGGVRLPAVLLAVVPPAAILAAGEVSLYLLPFKGFCGSFMDVRRCSEQEYFSTLLPAVHGPERFTVVAVALMSVGLLTYWMFFENKKVVPTDKPRHT